MKNASILDIDLTCRTSEARGLSTAALDSFTGGRGLGALLLYTNCRPHTNPLSSGNPLIICPGPLQGTNAFYSAKTALVTKSPLTDAYLYSIASGTLGHLVRRMGHDALIIRGSADEPLYLLVTDHGVEFRSARSLWGMPTTAAQQAMIDDAGIGSAHAVSAVASLVIGPAGEHLSPMACAVTGGDKARTFGRGGSGAVMGFKNLKGLLLASSRRFAPADPQSFADYRRRILKSVRSAPEWVQARHDYGSAADVMALNELGMLPTRNWQRRTFDGVEAIAPSEIKKGWNTRTRACGPHCPSPCSHQTVVRTLSGDELTSEGPEYETIYAFGSNCGVSSFDAIIEAEKTCDEAGLDTMSTGCTIAFVMECFERGLLSREAFGGMSMRFGDAEAVVEAVKLTAENQGIGSLLSQGTRRVSQQIAGSSDFAMHSKGMEFGGYECHSYWGQALQYAIDSRGGCHHGYGLAARTREELHEGTTVKGKGALIRKLAAERIIYDSAVVCAFARKVIDKDNLAGLIAAATGRDCSLQQLEEAAFRALTLERLFNTREGLGRSADTLPKRLTDSALADGLRADDTVPLDKLLDEAYSALGWDRETGIPTHDTIDSTGLVDILKDCE